MRWLVTGGLGFIGSHFIRIALRERPHLEIVNLDAITYAGNPANLRDVEGEPRYRFVKADICDPHGRTTPQSATASMPSSISPPRPTSTAPSSTPNASCEPTRWEPMSCWKPFASAGSTLSSGFHR